MRPALIWREAGDWYGVARRDVLAVMREPPLAAVPGAPPWLRGVANRFGRAVPVIDCGVLAERTEVPGPVRFALVLPVEGGELAVCASASPEERMVAFGGDTEGFFEVPGDPEIIRLVVPSRLVAILNRRTR